MKIWGAPNRLHFFHFPFFYSAPCFFFFPFFCFVFFDNQIRRPKISKQKWAKLAKTKQVGGAQDMLSKTNQAQMAGNQQQQLTSKTRRGERTRFGGMVLIWAEQGEGRTWYGWTKEETAVNSGDMKRPATSDANARKFNNTRLLNESARPNGLGTKF